MAAIPSNLARGIKCTSYFNVVENSQNCDLDIKSLSSNFSFVVNTLLVLVLPNLGHKMDGYKCAVIKYEVIKSKCLDNVYSLKRVTQ